MYYIGMEKFDVKEYFKTNNLVLAPMAGYSDIGFRHLCKKYGAGLVFTEMVSAKALLHNSEKTKVLMSTEPTEKPIALQLFGNDPEDFKNVLKLNIINKFDVIDINMGCPAPKIVKNGEGSALLEDIKLAEEIIKACVQTTEKPVSVKFRSGVRADKICVEEFATMCERAGASFITIHPRTREQGYSGHSDWELIKKVRSLIKIPIVASGDVLTFFDLKYLIDECGADAVMVGRGAVGRPEIFKELKTAKKVKLTLKQKIAQIKQHSKKLLKYYSYEVVSLEMKKHILAYVKSEPNATKLKLQIAQLNDINKIVELLENQIN